MLFKAFISYSHAADGKLAPTVQSALHRIAKPWYRLRTMRVFRDQANLSASPGLWSSIEAALRESDFFLFMASPTAARSPWTQREVEWWLANRSSRSFLILLTEGEIDWDEEARDFDWTATTALPPALRGAFSEEPLYTDLRWARSSDELSVRHSRFRAAILEVAATLLDRPKDELDGDDVRQHRRTRRIAWSGVAVLAALFLAATLSAYLATQERDLAISRALGTAAEARLPTDPELALLLAREAVRARRDDQAEYVLRRVFAQSPLRTIHHAAPGRTVLAEFVGPDLLIAAEPGKRAVLWRVSDGRRVAELPFEADDELAVSRSADGTLIALSGDTSVSVFETRGWRRVALLQGPDARFSDDGSVLLAPVGSQLRQWLGPHLREGPRIPLPEDYILRDVSSNGELLLLTLGSDPSPVRVVAAESGRTLATLPERVLPSGPVFSPDGRLLVTASPDGGVLQLSDARTGRLVRLLEEPILDHIGWTTRVTFSPDGQTLVTGNRNGVLHLWDVPTGRFRWSYPDHRNDVAEILFSHDGKTMLSSAADGTACLWDTHSTRCLATLGGRGDDVVDIALAPDAERFLTTHIDGTVRVWHREAWYPALTFPGERATLSTDGRQLLAAAREGALQLRDARSGAVRASLGGSRDDVNGIALASTGSLVAVAAAGRPVELWSAGSSVPTRQLGPASVGSLALAFSADGTRLATGSEQGTVRLWEVRDGRMTAEWRVSDAAITDLLFHPDGERLVVSAWDAAHVRDLASGEVLLRVAAEEEGSIVKDVALSADGAYLLVSGDKVPQLWALATGTRVVSLVGHTDEVYSGAFSPDARLLLTGSGFLHARGEPPADGNAVRLWDVRTRRELLQYRSAAMPVRQVAFGADGATIIAASMDGTVRVYRCEACLPLPALSRLVASRAGRDLTAEERARYLPHTTLLGWLSSYLPF